MMKFANVIYNYTPNNDDELELKEGDEIEVLGYEEEGWWKGKLRGRIGVFPSNFVKVSEVPAQQQQQQAILATGNQQSTPSTNKLLNLLGGKNSKASLSSNSLNSSTNSNNTSGNNNHHSNNNQNNNNNYHNQLMNTQQQASAGRVPGEDPAAQERRPKPIRGIGYGDIFAAGAKPKLSSLNPSGDTTIGSATDRLSSNSLQKQIPKKPPPPAPANATDDNNGSSGADQAPALPPKPSSQFSNPLLHHSKPPHPPPLAAHQQTTTAANVHQSARREQARVIYAYEPSNDDELALEAGDVIDIIDKEIEDQGWWKGELKGKIGVFPDNFVQLIEAPDLASNPSASSVAATISSGGAMSSAGPQDGWSPRTSNQQPQTIEGKIKSVFDGTPKGFTKELENNLVKQNGPASFLSLKRNKLATSESASDETNGKKDDSISSTGATTTSLSTTPKLNHPTANRAKGPSRRPPTYLFSKRAQSEPDKPDLNGKDEHAPLASLPVNSSPLTTSNNHDSLSSLPTGQNKQISSSNSLASSIIGAKLSPSSRPTSESISSYTPSSMINSSQPHMAANNTTTTTTATTTSTTSTNTITNDNHVITPKTSQRLNQQPNLPDKNTKPATTPSWMLELKKAHAEKRRDNPSTTTTTSSTTSSTTTTTTTPLQAPTNELVADIKSSQHQAPVTLDKTPAAHVSPSSIVNAPQTNTTPQAPVAASIESRVNLAGDEKRPSSVAQSIKSTYEPPAPAAAAPSVTSAVRNLSSRYSMDPPVPVPVPGTTLASIPVQAPTSATSAAPPVPAFVQNDSAEIKAHYESLVKQISNNFQSEIGELKDEIRRLRIDFQDMKELKSVIEVMKIELKACQSATESQKRWMKDLVDNLADERKKIAAMQTEIDRNLK